MITVLHSLNKSIQREDIEVYSFDIFDTVLTRATGTPEGLFHIMQQKMADSSIDLPTDFALRFPQLRRSASKQARKELQKECSISDIYGYLKNKFGLSADAVNALEGLEIEVELEYTRPISTIIRMIAELHNRNKRVIFVSDMFLPREALMKMLQKVGAYSEQDHIYVSHEFGKTKKHGDLFPVVMQREGCDAQKILHIGDNKRADYISARRNGLHSILFTEASINRYEKILLDCHSQENPLLGEHLCGAARQARLASPEFAGHHATLRQVGANVAGPILLFYVKWILEEAERNKLQRLYFLARDGQILLQVARKIYNSTGFRGELRYLYASRQALYLPATTEMDEQIIKWILLRKQYLTLEMIANRTGVGIDLLQEELTTLSGRFFDSKYNFSSNEIKLLKGLLKSQKIQEEILAQAAVWRANARNYLEQEGLFDDIPYGVVDLGVKGTLQDCIKDILLMFSPDRKNDLYGFYFGVNRFGKITGKYKKKYGYMFAPDCQQIHCPVSFSATRILEIFTTGDHGLTLAYQLLENGKWGPQLKEEANTDILDWGLPTLRGGIDAFLDSLCSFGEASIADIEPDSLKSIIIALLNNLANRPNVNEAEALGDHPFKNDPVESYTITFAPAFDLNLTLAYIKCLRNSELTSWIEGTHARSPALISFLLEPFRLLNFTKEGIRKGVMLWNASKAVTSSNNLVRTK